MTRVELADRAIERIRHLHPQGLDDFHRGVVNQLEAERVRARQTITTVVIRKETTK